MIAPHLDKQFETGATQVLRRPLSGMNDAADAPGWLKLPIFAGMGQMAAEKLRAAMLPVHFGAGEVLLRQGDDGDHMIVLEQGMVQVTVRGTDGQVVFERELEPPALLGEMALVTQEPRSATVVALTDVNGLRMDKLALEDMCGRFPKVAVFLTALVGDRLMESRGIRKVGKYEVVGRLGSGGVATVFEALHPALGKSVALKMLSHALVYDANLGAHFGREGRLVAQLDHDNIVRVIDTEEAYGTRFIVMEKLTGDLLDDVIKRGERLAWAQIRQVLVDLCRALAYSHDKGLIHRDVKPSNVFMTTDKRVKLLDFGIAIDVARSADGSHDRRIIGTPFYMAPEQISGHQLDGRADLYALGILAFELCTLELPFPGPTTEDVLNAHLFGTVPDPRALDHEVPEDLCEFVRISTAKKPDDRFGGCREAVEFLMRNLQSDVADPFELSTMAVSYLPSRRAQVLKILREAGDKLRRLRGVSVFGASQNELAEDKRTVQAPGAKS
jgi:serine/threonine protein kinase